MESFAPPPRRVAGLLPWRIMLGSLRAQLGWLVLAVGSLFFYGLVCHADVSGWRFHVGRVGHATGRWLYCRQTQDSAGRGRDRRRLWIFEDYFQYEILGRTYKGMSYADGACPGGRLPIEYLIGHPEIARVVGERRAPYSPWAILVAIVPFTGLWLVLSTLAEGRLRARLLRDGVETAGRPIEIKRTNVQSGRAQVYALTFEFDAQNGAKGRAVLRTSQPDRFRSPAGVPVFYDPLHPARAAVLASLPGSIAAGADGQPFARPSLAFLILPGLTILGHLWYWCRHL